MFEAELPMYPKGLKQRFMEIAAVVFVASFVIHIAAFWLAPVAPVLLVLGLLAVVIRLVLWWRGRGW
jgi:predicted signal transduction protein with EAL and GGDEF domain